MVRPEWEGASDEELERLLVERWVSRGLVVGVLAIAAIVSTVVAARGLAASTDRLIFAALLALAVAAALTALTMRRHDLQIHRELRRRRTRPRNS